LQAATLRVALHKTTTICSIYLPPTNFNSADLDQLLSQLPPPILLLGDFNSHSTLWGCTKLDRRGKQIEDMLTKQDLCFLNDTSSTYLHPAIGTTSALDLSICSPNLFLEMTWKVNDNLSGSDHYPIITENGTKDVTHTLPSWKLRKADWTAFVDQITLLHSSDQLGDSTDQFTENIISSQ